MASATLRTWQRGYSMSLLTEWGRCHFDSLHCFATLCSGCSTDSAPSSNTWGYPFHSCVANANVTSEIFFFKKYFFKSYSRNTAELCFNETFIFFSSRPWHTERSPWGKWCTRPYPRTVLWHSYKGRSVFVVWPFVRLWKDIFFLGHLKAMKASRVKLILKYQRCAHEIDTCSVSLLQRG